MKLTRSDVIDAISRRGKLDGADLSSLDFEGVDFDGVSLRGANLSGCDFTRASLRHCDLTGADLDGACLSDAQLNGARLFNADLSETDIDTAQGLFLAYGVIDAGIDPRGYRFIGVWHDDGWRVKAGCRWFHMARAEEHWTCKENEDALARLNVIKATVIKRMPVQPFEDDV